MSQRWTEEQLPDLTGRNVLITGANSGIGFEAARMIAARGAHVIMACRNRDKAMAAIADIQGKVPGASLRFVPLDVASLASVRDCARTVLDEHDQLHLLVNNAGVMAIPLARTEDGFEMQLGTNHLGHFALTMLLLPLLERTPAARVVNIASNAHFFGNIDFDNLDASRGYRPTAAYAQSKLANLLFTFELNRRLQLANASTTTTVCHPGYSDTNLPNVAPQMMGSRILGAISRAGGALVAQSSYMGALPTLRAAFDPGIPPGSYVGPRGPAAMWGYPVLVRSKRAARDPQTAAKLWQVSEELTGTTWPL